MRGYEVAIITFVLVGGITFAMVMSFHCAQ